MNVEGNYNEDGYAAVRGLVSPEIAQAFLGLLKSDLDQSGVPLSSLRQSSNLLPDKSIELYAYHYPPMLMFLWGLTPTVAQLMGIDLLPTYAYLRIYSRGDICRVHSDRHSCQHSLSLTLAYGDGIEWPLEIATDSQPEPTAQVDDDFVGRGFSSIAMKPGDGVLYKGVNHRHGRITPNPNSWSAHLFMHWVERGGPYASHAFDGHRQYLTPFNPVR